MPASSIRRGHLHAIPTILAATLGSICGITVSYTIGRTLGLEVVDHYGRWIHVTRADLHRVEQWMEHSGKWLLTFGYFIPGVRHITAIVAGSSELPRKIFALYAYSGAVIWSLSFLTLGWYVGSRWEAVLARVQEHTIRRGDCAGRAGHRVRISAPMVDPPAPGPKGSLTGRAKAAAGGRAARIVHLSPAE